MAGMFNGCEELKYLLLGNSFGIIQNSRGKNASENYLFATSTRTHIITLREEPMKFSRYLSYKYQIFCNGTLYVKNSTSNPTIEQMFEEADTVGIFGTKRIREVIELIGDSEITVTMANEYTDPGAMVAGYPSEDLEEFLELGLTFEVDTTEVDNAIKNKTSGEYTVTYTLKYNGEVFSTATRKVIVNAYYKNDANQYFATLADAFNSTATGGTITVLENVTDNVHATMPDNKTLILDLNGKTITSNCTSTEFIINKGNLTLRDSGGEGKLILTGRGYVINNSNILIVESGTYISECASAIDNSGTLTIKDGHIEGGTHGIYANAGEVYVNGGTIAAGKYNNNSYVHRGIYAAGTSNVTVTNGTITSPNDAIGFPDTSSGNLVVSGGNIFNKYDDEFANMGGTSAGSNYHTGDAIEFGSTGSCTITGGTIKSEIQNGVFFRGQGDQDLIISGGNISAPFFAVSCTPYDEKYGVDWVEPKKVQKGNVVIQGNATITTTGVSQDEYNNTRYSKDTHKDRVYAGVYINTEGTVTIGTQSGGVNITAPSIQGETYGIQSTNGFKFYDGILKGKTAAYTEKPYQVETGYGVYNGEEGEYKVAYLKKIAIIVPTPTELNLVYEDNGTITYTYNGDGVITVSASSEEICKYTLDAENKTITVLPEAIGTVEITITASGTEEYLEVSATVSVIISKKGIDVPDATDFIYNGTIQTGVNEDKSYTVAGTPSAIDAGTYTATVTPTSNYQWKDGTSVGKDITWSIAQKSIEVTWEGVFTWQYDGTPHIPTATAPTGITNETISLSITGEITDVGNGTATASISGVSGGQGRIENYTLTNTTKDFTITRLGIARPTASDKTYNRTEQSGVSEGTGYTLGGEVKGINAGPYITTVTLDKNHKWSTGEETEVLSLSWKINPKEIIESMITLEYSTTVYTGNELEPKVTVVDGTATLVNPSEYTVSYANNTNVGTAIVIIAGTGNYTGTPTVEFTITRKGIDVPTGTDYIYDGSSRTGVKESADYTITGTASATDAGTYTATVTPTSNYQWKDGTSGGKDITWEIVQKSIEVTWEGVFTWQYDGTPHIPSATAQSGVQNEAIVLSVTTAQSNVGDHVATASISKVNGGQGKTENYILTNNTKPFTITPKEIAVIWVPEQDKYEYTYNGQIQGPDVQKEIESALGEIITFGVRGKEKDAGSYTAEAYIVSITNGVTENYKVTNTNKEFVINRKDITVKANANQSKGPGEPEPDLTFTYEGNIEGEIPGFTGSLAREEGEGGGRYRIRRGTLELADTDTFKAGNYNLVFIDEDTEFVISYDKEKELILVFKITDTNNKLILPIPASTSNDYIVIWGDNNSDMYTKEGFPEHIYEKAGTYTVEIGGTVKNFGYYNSLRPTDSNIYNNYLSYTNQLTGIEQLGDVDAERVGFAFCENLTGDIPEANLDLSDLVSAENMFNNCVLLQGPIPTNLLAGAEKVNSAKNMFLNCENLTGTIPVNLFADTKEITTFESTFNNCKNLDGAIPAELFANGENVTTYAGTFKDCANLDGEIPAELFGKSTRVTTFKETFSNCTGLNTTISPRLFGTNPYVKNYYRTFYNCKGITGTIDENVFGSNVSITELPDKDLNNNFKQTFENCTGITDVRLISLVIGKEMFKDCTSIKTLKLEKTIDIGEKAFEGCNSLIQIEANNDYLRTIGIDAFEYTGTNPEKLLTKINRENELLLNYIWNDDNRLIDIEPPKGTVEIITPKDPYTNNEKVTLKITVEDNYSEPSNCKMVIMNEREYNEFANREYKDYDSLPWQDYAETVAWPLTSNDDLKTVYVLFKDEFGNANVVKDVLN